MPAVRGLNFIMPTGIVVAESVLVTRSGHRNSFQLATNVMMATVRRAGIARGRVVLSYFVLQPHRLSPH